MTFKVKKAQILADDRPHYLQKLTFGAASLLVGASLWLNTNTNQAVADVVPDNDGSQPVNSNQDISNENSDQGSVDQVVIEQNTPATQNNQSEDSSNSQGINRVTPKRYDRSQDDYADYDTDEDDYDDYDYNDSNDAYDDSQINDDQKAAKTVIQDQEPTYILIPSQEEVPDYYEEINPDQSSTAFSGMQIIYDDASTLADQIKINKTTAAKIAQEKKNKQIKDIEEGFAKKDTDVPDSLSLPKAALATDSNEDSNDNQDKTAKPSFDLTKGKLLKRTTLILLSIR